MSQSKPNKILFLAPYPFGRVGSQRFRFEQYWDVITAQHEAHFHSFLLEEDFEILYKEGHTLRKTGSVLKGFLRRFFLLFRVYRYDLIFIHREATPLGPPVFEWIIAKLFRKPIVFDFDDAIWLSNTSTENWMASFFKCHWKVDYICRWAWKVSCGNDFLCDYTKNFNPSVIFLPTTPDLEKIELRTTNYEPRTNPIIGWTGTHSTLKYLQIVLPVLQELEKEMDFQFLIIADKDPRLPLKNYRYLSWNKDSEWKDLGQIDIGLMPLGDSDWEEGKCGFKALQYMALGIPALASPTQANTRIIHHETNGFICKTHDDWKHNIKKLINDKVLRQQISEQGRKTVQEKFSKEAWVDVYQKLFSF